MAMAEDWAANRRSRRPGTSDVAAADSLLESVRDSGNQEEALGSSLPEFQMGKPREFGCRHQAGGRAR